MERQTIFAIVLTHPEKLNRITIITTHSDNRPTDDDDDNNSKLGVENDSLHTTYDAYTSTHNLHRK